MKSNRPTVCCRHRSLWLAGLAALFLSLSTSLTWAFSAYTDYWDPGLSATTPGSGGNGNWDLTTANWVRNTSGNDSLYPTGAAGLTFFEGVAGTVNLNASGLSALDMEFDTAGYVLQDAPGTNYALSLGNNLSTAISSGTVTVNVPLNLAGSSTGVSVQTGGTLALMGNITSSAGLRVGYSNTAGLAILSGNNAISGGTVVQYGTLELAGPGTNQPLGGTSGLQVTSQGTLLYSASNQLPAVLAVMLNSGTVDINGQSQDQAHALGALTVAGNAQLDFGPTLTLKSVLAFGNSSGAPWSGTLNVYNYHGAPGMGGGVDQLYFGTDKTGLTASQLGEIAFYSGGAGSTLLGTGIILSDGEVTYAPNAVPEPTTWAAVLAGTGLLGLVLRRRARKCATLRRNFPHQTIHTH